MAMEALHSVYDPSAVEQRLYQSWKSKGYFKPVADAGQPVFSVILPPPNVTGRLHMGHALTATIQDTLVRWRKMSGLASLWIPGTDHAGISTQVMVERALAKEGKTRQEVGREAFLERVWEWKEEHGGIIDRQHEALGAALDWERYRFTMDDVSSRAVREAFCRLHEEGLIYRAYRLINWDWASQTALSDLEVDHEERQGSLWHIAYPVEDSDDKLIVATTRPETMLGDTGVAVHPEDPRYKHLIGKHVVLPLTGRRVPIVGDDILVDMEFGTGAVKVTPAHDFNDFETGKRHDLELICVLDRSGKMADNVPEPFRGLPVNEARRAVVAALEAEGSLIKIEPHKLSVGISQRTRVPVEPMPSDQWFVRVEPLAKPALEAVRSGETKIFPDHRTADYYRWMENIHDWCISRQLWWGHRIPAWHCRDCGEITVDREDPTACKSCQSTAIEQDPDVLDTWFSSGLWPLTTLGWPEPSADLDRFYPNALMETGHDILFFWVARMMMFGIKFGGGKAPFKQVYLHSMVLGEDGRKMSKTKGNVVDPVDLVNEYGADSLRFYLATMAGQDQGIVFSRARVLGYRNFCNKLWNAARFVFMNLEGYEPQRYHDEVVATGDVAQLSPSDRWILSRACEVAIEVGQHFEGYRLDLAAHCIYQFVWGEYCDWYLELAKGSLRDDTPADRKYMTQGTLATVLDIILRVLHPLVPFITEEIWSRLPKLDASESLMLSDYPRVVAHTEDAKPQTMAGPFAHVGRLQADPSVAEACGDISRLVEVVNAARSLKVKFKLSPGKRVPILARTDDAAGRGMVERLGDDICRLAKLSSIELLASSDSVPKESATEVVRGIEVVLPLAGVVDLVAERKRLGKEIAKLEKDASGLDRKLGNEKFLAKAPAEVVAKDRARRAEIADTLDKLKATLESIS